MHCETINAELWLHVNLKAASKFNAMQKTTHTAGDAHLHYIFVASSPIARAVVIRGLRVNNGIKSIVLRQMGCFTREKAHSLTRFRML